MVITSASLMDQVSDGSFKSEGKLRDVYEGLVWSCMVLVSEGVLYEELLRVIGYL